MSRVAGRYTLGEVLRQTRGAIAWLAKDEETGKTVVALAQPARRTEALAALVGLHHSNLANVLNVLFGVPPESLPLTVMTPPIKSANSRLIASPNPVPFWDDPCSSP